MFCASRTPFQIRIVINSRQAPRHVTVPVNLLCRTVIKHVWVCPQSARSLSVNPLREIFAEYPLTYLPKIPI